MEIFRPAPPDLFWRVYQAGSQTTSPLHDHATGVLRTMELRRWLDRAGFADTWQRVVPIARWSPMAQEVRCYVAGLLAYFAWASELVPVPEDHRRFWRAVSDPNAPGHMVDHPDGFWCETQVVAVGRVSDQATA